VKVKRTETTPYNLSRISCQMHRNDFGLGQSIGNNRISRMHPDMLELTLALGKPSSNIEDQDLYSTPHKIGRVSNVKANDFRRNFGL